MIWLKLQIPMEFQKTAFYRLLYLSEIIPKWTDFNDIKETTDFSEITDSKEIKDISAFDSFSKESLIPFGVLVL